MLKYFSATFAFVFMFVGTAVVCGFIMNIMFPPNRDMIFAGVGLDWRNVPGTILGLWAGIHSARVSLRKGREREAKLQQKI